jgi:apolipoprotein N-acyltransferase
MSVSAEHAGGLSAARDEPPRHPAPWRARAAALAAGALPVAAFPRLGLDLLAWVALVPVLLLIRSARTGREAADRGWWFGAGLLTCALYWLAPNIGPGLVLVAVVAGALWAPWGHLVWACWRTDRPVVCVVAVACGWVVIEWARSWSALGGPWGLYGATQWRHPAVLGLASLGGIWLVSFVLVAANTALAMAITRFAAERRTATGMTATVSTGTRRTGTRTAPGPGAGAYPAAARRALPAVVLALLATLAGPVAYRSWSAPAAHPLSVALVQPGMVDGPGPRFEAEERITRTLPAADLVVWGESSVGFDLRRRPDLVARLAALAREHGALLVNEDARDATGRISKSAVLIGPEGVRGRYVKNRLVPFGEYIPLRHALGWLTRISEAAKEDRVPGSGFLTMRADGVTFGPLICFESTFPDLGRTVVAKGAQLVVYESATSTFQGSWAPPQHAALGAVRAAETGRPVVQAALTGVSAAFDERGRRLAWLDTDRRGAVTIRITPEHGRTPYDRFGDYVAWLSAVVVLTAVYGVRRGARGSRPGG